MRKQITHFAVIAALLSLPASLAHAQAPPGEGMMTDMQCRQMMEAAMDCGMCGMGMSQGMMGGMGMGMGQGMMHGMGMGMGMEMGMMADMRDVWMLDLSDEQRASIRKIHDALRKEHWEIKGKMMDAQVKLRDLHTGEKMDEKKIGAAIDRIHALKKEMVMTGVAAMNKVLEVLTKEQRDQLRKSVGYGMDCPGCPKHRHGMMHR